MHLKCERIAFYCLSAISWPKETVRGSHIPKHRYTQNQNSLLMKRQNDNFSSKVKVSLCQHTGCFIISVLIIHFNRTNSLYDIIINYASFSSTLNNILHVH